MPTEASRESDGAIAAALVAGGIGTTALGVLVVLAEASGAVGDLLNVYPSSGSLSGKAGVTVLVWLASWFLLDRIWAGRRIDLTSKLRVAAVLVLIGLLGTFPPFFYLFG